MNKLISIGALLAMLAVVFGAFGAHALKGQLDGYYLDIYKTAVLYHLIHALGVLFTGIIAEQLIKKRQVIVSGYLMLTGTVIFSGSLYLLAISGKHWLGMITPTGGVLLILAWGLLAWAGYSRKS